ncbi:MAG: DUF1330 domain-containing protein [Candidatus Kapabacteria bacterium]|nr:DUF1330 domain-containing protein [Candidatus Kapabacteria bacterium]
MIERYLTPTQESGRKFFMRKISGSVVMLNLLRFRDIADYSETPELSPPEPITGEAAYQLYIEHTLPYLERSGGEIVFMGSGGDYLVGPIDERWDSVLLIRQDSVESFIAFAQNEEYLKGLGHRTAALEDSRLLPLVQTNDINSDRY